MFLYNLCCVGGCCNICSGCGINAQRDCCVTYCQECIDRTPCSRCERALSEKSEELNFDITEEGEEGGAVTGNANGEVESIVEATSVRIFECPYCHCLYHASCTRTSEVCGCTDMPCSVV